jgi:hypothetical protein
LLPGVRKDEIGIMQLLQATESAVEHRDEYFHEWWGPGHSIFGKYPRYSSVGIGI